MALKIEYNTWPVPTIREFQRSDAFIKAVIGPFGSGKSAGCVLDIIQRGCAQKPDPQDGIRRTRWAIVRNTYGQLRDTSMKTVDQWFPPHIWGEFRAMDHRYRITAFENTEIEILYRALDRPDQVSNLLSLELTGAWVNEAREVPWAIIEALQGRVGRFPAQRDGGPTWHGILMDTNPPDVDSKWFKFFETQKHPETFAKLFKQPSGLSEQAENLPNLPGGRQYYERLAIGKDPEWIKVYVHGEYGFVIDGKAVYPEYHDQSHCRPVQPDPRLPVYRGWDFGLTPSCILAQLNALGQLIVFDELVSEEMGIDRFGDEVVLHCNTKWPELTEYHDYGDPAGEKRAETDEKTCFQVLASKGIYVESGLQTLAIRIESVRKPLRTFALKGEPGMLMDPRCKTLRKGFQGGYQYRRMQTSSERYTATPDKNMYSHIHDALQYVCSVIFGGGLTSMKQPPGWEPGGRDTSFEELDRNPVTGY